MPGKLPIGIHDFSMLREDHFLYVDKTAQLEKLIAMGQRYFCHASTVLAKAYSYRHWQPCSVEKQTFFKVWRPRL